MPERVGGAVGVQCDSAAALASKRQAEALCAYRWGPDARHRSERVDPEPVAHHATLNDGVVAHDRAERFFTSLKLRPRGSGASGRAPSLPLALISRVGCFLIECVLTWAMPKGARARIMRQ